MCEIKSFRPVISLRDLLTYTSLAWTMTSSVKCCINWSDSSGNQGRSYCGSVTKASQDNMVLSNTFFAWLLKPAKPTSPYSAVLQCQMIQLSFWVAGDHTIYFLFVPGGNRTHYQFRFTDPTLHSCKCFYFAHLSTYCLFLWSQHV